MSGEAGYREIDMDSWARREYFTHYTAEVPCTYSMTVRLDITALKRGGDRLYPAMLYLLARTVREFEQFRTAFRPDGTLAVYEGLHPSYTIFHKEDGTFSSIWTEYAEDHREFFRRYREDVERYGKTSGFCPKPGMPENCFNASMIPWTAFESFQLNTPGFRYLLPIFTMGKYQDDGPEGRRTLPLAVQVHHAVCDGYHLSVFLRALQEKLDDWLQIREGSG